MNIQIFGKDKCFQTRSAIRFFKERKIKYQYVDMAIKGMSKKELLQAIEYVKDIDLFFDKKSPLYESLNIEYIMRTKEDKFEILLLNPSLIKTPVVREIESRKASVGENIAEWKSWLK